MSGVDIVSSCEALGVTVIEEALEGSSKELDFNLKKDSLHDLLGGEAVGEE